MISILRVRERSNKHTSELEVAMAALSTCIPTEQNQSPPPYLAPRERNMTTQVQEDEIPDGGFSAYLQVFGAHLLFYNSW